MTKTFDRKDIFSWANAEDAEKYIGKMGFFAENLTELQDDVEHYNVFQLRYINTKDALATFAAMNFNKPLFLPIDKIREEEKKEKYRPFKTIKEFSEATNYPDLGDSLTLRSKSDPLIEFYVGYNGYSDRNGELLGITFGSGFIKPQQLLDLYEFFNYEAEWQPFGVLEE